MVRRLPPPNWLRAFEAAARHLSFTSAARELHVTQSAVSQQVRLLEAHVREPLFQRLPRGLRLTDAGEAYLPTVNEAFTKLSERTEELFGHHREDLVTIRVNASFAVLWLSRKLPLFRASHPKITIRITTSVWLSEVEWEGLALEVRHGSGSWSGLESERLTVEHLIPVCAPMQRRLHPVPVRIDELDGQTLLHIIGNQHGWPYYLAVAGVEHAPTSLGVQFDSSAVMLEAAAAGLGIGLTSRTLCDEALAENRVQRAFDLSVPTPEAFFLTRPDSRTTSQSAERFREWLLEETETLRN